MKDLLLAVHVVVKTLNLEISRCHLADYVKEFYLSACCTCSTIIFPHSTNQIIVFWRCLCRSRRLCLSSLMTNDRDAKKWSPENLPNHDYFAIIPACFHSAVVAKYTIFGPEGPRSKKLERNKNKQKK